MSAAITTPQSNFTPRTEVPVTMGFLGREEGLEGGAGESRVPLRAGCSAADVPRLLSFPGPRRAALPLAFPGSRNPPVAPGPTGRPLFFLQAEAPRAYWVRVIGPRQNADAGSTEEPRVGGMR